MLIYSLSASNQPDIVRYVGYTKKPLKKRLIEHLSDSKTMRTHKDKWLQKELKNGNQILIEEIDSGDCVLELKNKEIGYIRLLKSIGAKLVNGTTGGDGVIGLVHSDKFKEWNRATKSKPINCFDYKTKELIKTYPSATIMCEELELTRSQVGYVLSGHRNYHKGYTFSYSKSCPVSKPKKNTPVWNKGKSNKGLQGFKTTLVMAYNADQRLLFPTVNAVCKYFGIKFHSQICRVIKTGGIHKGFKFIKYKAGEYVEI